MQRIFDLIEGLPLFEGLSQGQLEGVASLVVDRKVERGQMVFCEGAPAEGFYVVAEGRIKVFRSGPDGREAIMHVLGPG